MSKKILLVLLVCIGCGKVATKQELQQYLRADENGLIHRRETAGTLIEIIYKPKDLVIAQEVGSDGKRWSEIERELDSLDYFVLKLSRNNQEIENSLAGDPGRFTRAVSYLAGEMSADVSLQIEGEKLDVEDMIYVQTFGSASGSNILFVFKSALEKRDEDFSFVFDDAMFGTGRSQFDFEIEKINDIPKLKLD
jgi:hypothetical protein